MHPDTPPHRTATHDGQIWTRPRHKMTDAASIRRRMAQETRAEIMRAGADAVITREDFRRRGWSDSQVAEHLPAAIDMATAGMQRGAA